MNRTELLARLRLYETPYPDEKDFALRFTELLQHPDAYRRTHLPGHITGSAWIVDEACEYVLLTHHAKLDRWLQPGGHADGDENILAVALREAEEETGITKFRLIADLFDIDIHTIPMRKEFPEHLHYDVRVLLQASKKDRLNITEESVALDWVSLKDLSRKTENNASMLRMADKASKLFASQQK